MWSLRLYLAGQVLVEIGLLLKTGCHMQSSPCCSLLAPVLNTGLCS